MSRHLVRLVLAGIMVSAALPAWSDEIHEAVRARDLGRVTKLIEANPQCVSVADTNGLTPLYTAVYRGFDEITRHLLLNTPCVYGERFLDTRTPEGQKARQSGLLERTLGFLLPLAKENPRHERVLFALGMVLCSLDDGPAAREAFQHVLEINPSNHRARAELARVLARIREPDLARQEIAKALAFDLMPEDRRVLESCMEQIQQDTQRSFFSGRVDVGYLDDDNVNLGPESESIETVPIIYGSRTFSVLTVPQETRPARGKGEFAVLGLSGGYDPGERGEWMVVGEGSYYQNWLDGRSENETAFYQVGAGLRHVEKRSLIQLPLIASHITYGQKNLVDMYGISPTYITLSGPKGDFEWITRVSAQWRDYSTLDDRDGAYVAAGETVRRVIGDGGHTLSLGLTWFGDYPDADIYQQTGLIWSLSGTLNLPWHTVIYGQTSYTTGDYRRKEDLSPEKRSDTQRQYVAGIDKRILGGWGVDVSLQHIENDSTFALYQYQRNIVTACAYLLF